MPALCTPPAEFAASTAQRNVPARLHFAFAPCTLGLLLVAGIDEKLYNIALGDNRQDLYQSLQNRYPSAQLEQRSHTECEHWLTALVDFIEHPKPGLSLPLMLQGTDFQQRTWAAIQTIPCGTTATYAALAQQIGAPRAARAVANACGSNPLALIIPCHRVIRTDGSLGGYRWGIARKQELLAREKNQYTRFC